MLWAFRISLSMLEPIIKQPILQWNSHCFGCHYTKSNPIDDSKISSKMLQKQIFKPLGHYTCMQCGTSHLQNSPRKHTVAYHFSDLQDVYSGNHQIYTKCQLQYLHPPHISTSGKCHCVIIHQTTKATEYMGRCQSICTCHLCHIYAPITAFVKFTPYKCDGAPQTLTWQSLDLVQCHLQGICSSFKLNFYRSAFRDSI